MRASTTYSSPQAYTLRWLAEVFFEDWKLYEGWGREARQFDEEGAVRGLILSLSPDHALLLHPEQTARLENRLPACTVGSLQRLAQTDSLLEFVKSILQHQNPGGKLKETAKAVKDLFQLIPSAKHMSGRDLGRLEPGLMKISHIQTDFFYKIVAIFVPKYACILKRGRINSEFSLKYFALKSNLFNYISM